MWSRITLIEMGVELTGHLENTIILTALVALFVLWRYRVAVLQGMGRAGGVALPLPVANARPEDRVGGTVVGDLASEKRLQRDIALAYLLSTFICALPMATVMYLRSYRDQLTVIPAPLLTSALAYAIACAPMIAASVVLAPKRALEGLLLLIVVLVAASASAYTVQRLIAGLPVGWTPLWSWVSGLPGLLFAELWFGVLLFLVFWPRKVRAVAPITFAALLLFGLIAPYGARIVANIAARWPRAPVHPSEDSRVLWILMAIPAGWIAWRRLRRVARGYERKRFSDAQLLSRTGWLLVVASVWLTGTMDATLPLFWFAGCAAAVIMFPPVNRLLLSRVRRAARQRPARSLLLLRAFGYTRRTERLFDHIGERWRLFGPVHMIAAPDVVARTIDAGEYLRWLTGRIDELFVTSRSDLDARLAALDVAPDPDGRYRVNELCCRDDTWQATVVELMQRADAVVMDVRGVTCARHGCEFELRQLAERLLPRRVVLVTDASTERAVLESAFGPKLSAVRIIQMRRWRHTDAVFEALLQAAA